MRRDRDEEEEDKKEKKVKCKLCHAKLHPSKLEDHFAMCQASTSLGRPLVEKRYGNAV